MSTRYPCNRPRRLQALRAHLTLNGIEYLDVLDRDAIVPGGPPWSPRQRTLLVRVDKPLASGAVPFDGADARANARHVQIEGGVRVTDVRALWAARADDAEALHAAGLVGPEERAYLLAQPHPDATLAVRTDRTGDYDTYTLALVAGASGTADDTPLPGFDALLSRVAFSFKAECPSPFDCAPEPVCPPSREDAPPIDYLAKDYASFRRLMLDRLAVVLPEWRERSAADLGIALVEAMAYVGDRLSYFQDAAATEAYLGTARRRTSVRRHARLLDYPMHDGSNARAWVAVEADEGVTNARLAQTYGPEDAREHTRFLTHVPGLGPAPDAAELARIVREHVPLVFEPMHDVRLFAAHNTIAFHTWGDQACVLPRGATSATLREPKNGRLHLRPGDVLVFEERVSPATGAAADADPTRRHAVRLTRVAPEALADDEGVRSPAPSVADDLYGQDVVEIEWAEADALPFALCLSAVVSRDGVETLEEEVSVARGNVVLADHGRTLAPETLPTPDDARYRPILLEPGLTQRVPLDAQAWGSGADARAATDALVQDPREALPDAMLDAGGVDYEPSRDLLSAGPFEREFVVETEADGRASLRFGDGTHGLAPAPGAALAATYRVGSGPAGNVGAGAIRHVATAPGLGIVGVRNPLPGRGGTAPEPLEDVRLYAPQAFRRQERAVTAADYAEVAERHPAVARAVARRRWTGSWHTVFVTVDRVGGRDVDRAFEDELSAWIGRFALAGHDVEIEPPRFVPLDLALTVCAEPGALRSRVRRALLDAFSRHDLPSGERGFFHPDRLTFGQPVHLSAVVAHAMAVPGVRWVSVDREGTPPGRFRRWGERPHGEIESGQIAVGPFEIARLDNDPNARENGRIEFHVTGGL